MPVYEVTVVGRNGEQKKVSFPMERETYEAISSLNPSERVKYFTDEYHDYNRLLSFRKKEVSLDEMIAELGDSLPILCDDENFDPAKAYERSQADSLVRTALSTLSTRYKEILLLSEDGGGSLSKAEIARRLSIDRSTVSKIVASAKKKIKEFLESRGFDYHG